MLLCKHCLQPIHKTDRGYATRDDETACFNRSYHRQYHWPKP